MLRQREGAHGLTFEYCLIAAGSSHTRAPSHQVIQAGDVISLDSGGNKHGYIGDIARICVVGAPDDELVELLPWSSRCNKRRSGRCDPTP